MNVRRGALICIAFSLSLAAATPARAQVVQYEFTGTWFRGSEDFGETVSGVVALDLDAPPDSLIDYSTMGDCGQNAVWQDGNFTVDAVTSAGIAAGTHLGGTTYFDMIDHTCRNPPFLSGHFFAFWRDDQFEYGVRFLTQTTSETGDGIASVSKWTPLDDEFTLIRVYQYELATETFVFGDYHLATFELIRDTIVIDGCDTGVEDFEYDGRLVSEILDELAAAAKSHGQYKSKVAKLLRELRRAGVITTEEAESIQHCADESTIGVRPKGQHAG